VSQERIEIVRRSFEAFNERDFDAMLADWSDDVVMRLVGGFADLMGAEFKGHDGVRRWMDEWVGSLAVRAEIEDVFEAGDRVVVIARAAGAGEATGAPVEVRGGQVYSFRGRQICAVENYYDAREALASVGVAE
jgi:ketosteroid isomerase-like protein